jgi:hypothetical protein
MARSPAPKTLEPVEATETYLRELFVAEARRLRPHPRVTVVTGHEAVTGLG